MYGNLSIDVWNLYVWKLSQIPPCLGLCTKNPNKCVFGWSKFSFDVDLFWFWFGMKISVEKGEKYPIPIFNPTPLRLGEGMLA